MTFDCSVDVESVLWIASFKMAVQNPIAQRQLPLLNTATQSLAVVAQLTKESIQIATKFSGLFAEIITCLVDILIMYIYFITAEVLLSK